jgi:methionine synthase I (cobalamin-dependent)
MRFTDCVRGTLTLADGAWGTELLSLGARIDECLDAWNLTAPDRVRQVAENYVSAGARIILTNTFRSNSFSLAHYGLQDQCDAINRSGVRISREAAGTSAMVFASIGPTGEQHSTRGVSHTELHRTFSQQARALASETPDAILIETMTDLEEARIAAAAALATNLPTIVSFVFVSREDGLRTAAGSTPEQAATVLASEGVHGVGANCCDLHESIAICRRLAAASPLPIWIKPNSGVPELIHGRAHYKTTPQEFATAAGDLSDAGATFLGGCCGTTPEFTRVLARQPVFRRALAHDY